jgi:hypothetical protein
MLQDRNIHRDARALRKSVSIPIIAPAFGVDQDEPIYVSRPRYNWRLSDLQASTQLVTTASLIVKAQAVPHLAAVGSPQLTPAAAVTFLVEEFWRFEQPSSTAFTNIAAIAAQAFGADGIATVLDGFWGVWLLVVDTSNTVGVVRQAPIMAFATEEIALANCPKPRGFVGSSGATGRCAILTINAVGGDFIAGTTNTDAALVAAFNTGPQDGHVMAIAVQNRPQLDDATLGQQLKDASGTNILQGTSDDALVLTVRSAGAPVITGGLATVDYRPWPAGGEGVGDASVSQNRPSFVP